MDQGFHDRLNELDDVDFILILDELRSGHDVGDERTEGAGNDSMTFGRFGT